MSVFAGVKLKPAKGKIKRDVDADGKEREFDVRADSEQEVKYNEIIELLLVAGYFRARINGLEPFDKVVGGMSWSITMSQVDLDVDLLFQENSTIGQKIALTEKIVAALPRMKCPHRIEPHQIQGLDYIHIFPVIQWLVKRVIETRAEMGDYIRKYSESQFNKHRQLPQDIEFDTRKPSAMSAVSTVKSSYKAERRFRQPTSNVTRAARNKGDEATRVQTTLLEYGHRYRIGRDDNNDGGSKKKKKKKGAEGDEDANKESAEALAEAERIQALMGGLAQTEEGDSLGDNWRSAVGVQGDAIREMMSRYKALQGELETADTSGASAHKRAVASLEKQVGKGEKRLTAVSEAHASVMAEFEAAQEKLRKALNYNGRIDREMAKFDALETEENRAIISKLKSLIAMNESLKESEGQFKRSCVEEKARLEGEIDKMRSDALTGEGDEQARILMIQRQYEKDQEKLQKIRVLLGRKLREIVLVQRHIDEIPSRAELAQYQKRFVELYNQIASKLSETKQYYTFYNTLDDSKRYMEKEQELLSSIHDNFGRAMSSNANRDTFMRQFEQIVAGVRGNLEKVETRQGTEKTRRDSLNATYLALVDKQREYYKTVRDFQEECRRNEELTATLRAQKKSGKTAVAVTTAESHESSAKSSKGKKKKVEVEEEEAVVPHVEAAEDTPALPVSEPEVVDAAHDPLAEKSPFDDDDDDPFDPLGAN